MNSILPVSSLFLAFERRILLFASTLGMKADDTPDLDHDLELAKSILAGDRKAFDRFVEELLPVLHRFASRRLRDEDVVHDVVQSSVCKAIESLPSYRGNAPLLSWACGICRFEVFAVYKRRRRVDERELVDESREIQDALAMLRAPESPDTELERRQTVSLVHLTLDHLSEDHRSVLEMKYVQGLSVREIAAQRGASEKSCESLLTRARVAFRKTFPMVSDGLEATGRLP